MYMDSHDKDKIVVRPSYFYNGNPYTSKMASLYSGGHLNIKILSYQYKDPHVKDNKTVSQPSYL